MGYGSSGSFVLDGSKGGKDITQPNEIQRNPTHRFSPKGSFAFSTKEARRRFLSRFNSLGALPSVASLLPQFSFSLQQVVTFNFFLRGTLDVVVGTAVYGRLRWPDGRTGADRDRALSDSAPVARGEPTLRHASHSAALSIAARFYEFSLKFSKIS